VFLHRTSVVKVCYLLGSTLFAIALFLLGSSHVHGQTTPVELVVPDTVLIISGKTAPNSFVTIKRGKAVISTLQSDSNGDFSQSIGAQPFGAQTISIFSRDQEGVATDTVSQAIHIEPQTDTYIDFFLPPTLTLSTANIQEGSDLTVRGTGYPNSTVEINIDNNYFLQVKTDASGRWQSVVSTDNFFIGKHTVNALVVDSIGSQSARTLSRVFTVFGDPNPPLEAKIPVITSPYDGQRFGTRNIVVSGSAQENVRIELFSDGELVGSIFSNSHGRWSIPLSLYGSSASLRARECVGGVCGQFSDTVDITFVGDAPADGLRLSLNDYSLTTRLNDKLKVNARISDGNEPYELYVEWGDGLFTRRTQLQEGVNVLDHSYFDVGYYNATITATDQDGNTTIQFFTVEVIPAEGGVIANIWWVFLAAFLIVYSIEHYWRTHWYHKRRKTEVKGPKHIPF